MRPEAQLGDFVQDLLPGGPLDAAVGTLAAGLAAIGVGIDVAQERRGHWDELVAGLRDGSAQARPALEYLRRYGGPGFAGLVEFADRQVTVAGLILDEVQRLRPDGPTRA